MEEPTLTLEEEAEITGLTLDNLRELKGIKKPEVPKEETKEA